MFELGTVSDGAVSLKQPSVTHVRAPTNAKTTRRNSRKGAYKRGNDQV